MPGRLSIYDDEAFKADIVSLFGGFKDDIKHLHKRYNIAPTIEIPIYTNEKVYSYAHFGLIPSWANARSSMQINARSETVFEKSSFKEAYKARRCLIPVNGYFEWKKDPQTKKSQAHFIVSTTHSYFTFAGIYECWYDNTLKKTVLSVALLTTEPNDIVATIHDRMPVILESEQWKVWLNGNSSYAELNRLYTPLENDKMKYYLVGDAVNNVKNDTIMCIKEKLHSNPRQGSLF